MINGSIAESLMNLTLQGKFLPLTINLWSNFIPFVVLLVFGLILLGIYIWTEDSLLPALLLLLYWAVALLPSTPTEIKQAMLPELAKPLLYVFIALSFTPVIVNLILRNRGY